MNNKQIIVVKPKTLSPKDRSKLTKYGNIVIEHPAPIDIIYKSNPATLTLTHVNCVNCGDRIYMTEERIAALKTNHYLFYCPRGHKQSFTK